MNSALLVVRCCICVWHLLPAQASGLLVFSLQRLFAAFASMAATCSIYLVGRLGPSGGPSGAASVGPSGVPSAGKSGVQFGHHLGRHLGAICGAIWDAIWGAILEVSIWCALWVKSGTLSGRYLLRFLGCHLEGCLGGYLREHLGGHLGHLSQPSIHSFQVVTYRFIRPITHAFMQSCRVLFFFCIYL